MYWRDFDEVWHTKIKYEALGEREYDTLEDTDKNGEREREDALSSVKEKEYASLPSKIFINPIEGGKYSNQIQFCIFRKKTL